MRSFATLRMTGEVASDHADRPDLRHACQGRRASCSTAASTPRAILERAVAHVNALDPRPDVVLATGDLVDGGKPEEYARLRRLLAPLAMPVYLIPGNHDARDALRAVFADHAYLPRSRLPAVHDRGPAGAPDRARYAGAGQGLWRAVRRAAGLAGGAARRKRPADDALHASSAVRLRHRRLRRHAAATKAASGWRSWCAGTATSSA